MSSLPPGHDGVLPSDPVDIICVVIHNCRCLFLCAFSGNTCSHSCAQCCCFLHHVSAWTPGARPADATLSPVAPLVSLPESFASTWVSSEVQLADGVCLRNSLQNLHKMCNFKISAAANRSCDSNARVNDVVIGVREVMLSLEGLFSRYQPWGGSRWKIVVVRVFVFPGTKRVNKLQIFAGTP